MSSNIFLKIDGINGESHDSNHKGWIDVDHFDIDATQPGSMSLGGGGGVGKVRYSDLAIFAKADRATPTIFSFAASGKHITKVVVSVCKAGGDQIEFIRITLENVIVTYCGYNGSPTKDLIPVTYRFQAEKITHQYWQQTELGTKGGEVSTSWDIKKNQSF